MVRPESTEAFPETFPETIWLRSLFFIALCSVESCWGNRRRWQCWKIRWACWTRTIWITLRAGYSRFYRNWIRPWKSAPTPPIPKWTKKWDLDSSTFLAFFALKKENKEKFKVRGKAPELKQGRSHGESQGANSACGFLFGTRFAPCGLPLLQLRDRFDSGTLPGIGSFRSDFLDRKWCASKTYQWRVPVVCLTNKTMMRQNLLEGQWKIQQKPKSNGFSNRRCHVKRIICITGDAFSTNASWSLVLISNTLSPWPDSDVKNSPFVQSSDSNVKNSPFVYWFFSFRFYEVLWTFFPSDL